MRVWNFSAGPAMLPPAVLETARAELTDWQGSGVSVMEVSHRSEAFRAMATAAEADLRHLLAVPPNYRVLFLPGGATLQFAAIPLNLAAPSGRVDYIDTGLWSVKAIDAARLALVGDGQHSVSLDKVIATMKRTGEDMKDQYKETSLGGLAVNVIEC